MSTYDPAPDDAYLDGKAAAEKWLVGGPIVGPQDPELVAHFNRGWNEVVMGHQAANPKPPVPADAIGATVIPDRYAGERECIDLIRDNASEWFLEALRAGCDVADAAFAVHCMSCAFKYRFRTGKKDVEAQEIKKAEWYEQMFAHLCGHGEDPRALRPGFTGYVRP